MKLKIAVCDDEIKLAEMVKEKIIQLRENSMVDLFTSGEELLSSSLDYEIIFLDIEMPKQDGMQVAKGLWERGYEGQVVFLTSHSEYMQEAFKVKAYRYLFKPINDNQMREVLASVETELAENRVMITVNKDRVESIRMKDIIYLEAARNKTFLVLVNGELECNRPMKEVFELIGSSEFVQIHKSYIVSLQYIKKIGQKSLQLEGVVPTLPLSRRKRVEVGEKYLQYVKKHAEYLSF